MRLRDPRNRLLAIPVDIALEARAHVILIENVPGILALPRASYWLSMRRRLGKAGYNLRTIIVDASAIGLPQRRRRVIFIAVRGMRDIPELKLVASNHSTARSLLTIPSRVSNHEPRPLAAGTLASRIAPYISPGQKLSNVRASSTSVHTWEIPEVFGSVSTLEVNFLESFLHLRRQARRRTWGDADPVSGRRLSTVMRGSQWRETAEALVRKGYLRKTGSFFDLRHTFNGKFRRPHPDQPTPSVLTKFCQPEYFLHPWEDRAFTVREAARLQGFHDDFTFVGSHRSQAAQVGNAVPPPLAYQLAAYVRDRLL